MQINFNNNINFNGGFRFPQMNQTGKELLETLPKRGKQIFYDFEKQGDVFLILKDKKDLKFAKKARDMGITDCIYYPEINTSGGFDEQLPDVLSEALKGKKAEPINRVKKYRTIDDDGNIIIIDPAKVKPAPPKPNPDFITNILNALSISTDGIHIQDKYGSKIIEDATGKIKVYISPANRNKVRYVYVDKRCSDYSDEAHKITRYAIKSGGTIVKRYAEFEDIQPFMLSYNSLLKK